LRDASGLLRQRRILGRFLTRSLGILVDQADQIRRQRLVYHFVEHGMQLLAEPSVERLLFGRGSNRMTPTRGFVAVCHGWFEELGSLPRAKGCPIGGRQAPVDRRSP
jgi:hypothetical protein